MRKNLEKVRVLDLSIKNVSCFENISISFNKKFNFICGANGIGKTSILNIIGASFISLHHIRGVHRNALSSQPGEWSIVCKLDRRIVENKLETRSFYPDEQTAPHGFYRDYAKHIIHLKTNRDFQYEGLHSIDRDPVGDESSYQMAALVGVKQGNIKPWLANRFIFKQIPDNGWDADMIENNDLALKCFSLLDRSVEFSHIDTMSLDIYVKTKH
ncbi:MULTISPECIES: ATP-binding protein [unclassified Azospirillum]|uniref:AAA family ATPase n=1 Tax=unclassified Azospirillum TaxID=2630922 RepID=UPI001304C521|nr:MULTISPECIES: ATP-binding protein [unclassified Azospirillum]